MSVRVDETTKARLERLALSTGRSRSYLAAEAINEYLNVNEWQVAGIERSIVSIDSGRAITHQAVRDWVASWGGDNERVRPEPAKQ
jgi:predicted transcriptional regulator